MPVHGFLGLARWLVNPSSSSDYVDLQQFWRQHGKPERRREFLCPRGSLRAIKSAILIVITLNQFGLAYTRGRAIDSPIAKGCTCVGTQFLRPAYHNRSFRSNQLSLAYLAGDFSFEPVTSGNDLRNSRCLAVAASVSLRGEGRLACSEEPDHPSGPDLGVDFTSEVICSTTAPSFSISV